MNRGLQNRGGGVERHIRVTEKGPPYSNAGGKPRHSAALREFRSQDLNGLQRSVNRKVQGSNPWPGAKYELDSCSARAVTDLDCNNGAATVQVVRVVNPSARDMAGDFPPPPAG